MTHITATHIGARARSAPPRPLARGFGLLAAALASLALWGGLFWLAGAVV